MGVFSCTRHPCTGYLGYKKTLARGSVGLRFLKTRKPSENPGGPIVFGLRKRTKAVGPRFLKSQGNAEKRSVHVFLKLRKRRQQPVGARKKAPDRRTLQGYLAHKTTPTPLGPP